MVPTSVTDRLGLTVESTSPWGSRSIKVEVAVGTINDSSPESAECVCCSDGTCDHHDTVATGHLGDDEACLSSFDGEESALASVSVVWETLACMEATEYCSFDGSTVSCETFVLLRTEL